MNKQRAILHCDINHCFAQIEEMKYPYLREVPMIVGGDEAKRHGIVLAKNLKAKEYSLKTGEPLCSALKKCKDLVIVKPVFEDYVYYTEKVKDIYREYSDKVESYGLDEAWVDVSESTGLFGDGDKIAAIIQRRVRDELGLTISVGSSFNKIFAKLGSDMRKPYGLVSITEDNFKERVWPLPVSDLLYVGPATQQKCLRYGIHSIQDLANTDILLLKKYFGKMGEMLYYSANGMDVSNVRRRGQRDAAKSIGNSVTAIRDICTENEVKEVYYVLAESVASRLRDAGLKGKVISIGLRTNRLESFTRQMKCHQATDTSAEIMEIVMTLFRQHYQFEKPLRSIGVSVSDLSWNQGTDQLSLFADENNHSRNRQVDLAMDDVRKRFGQQAIKRCCVLMNEELTDFHPKSDHTIHPAGYF